MSRRPAHPAPPRRRLIVLDASAAVEFLLDLPAGAAVAARVNVAGETMHAPHLLDAEVTHALGRYALRGEITPRRGREALEDLASLRVRRYSHVRLVPRMWELRAKFSSYDAAYVAVADALAAPLLTTDRALTRAPGHRARIELP